MFFDEDDSSTAILAGGDGKALGKYFTEIVPEYDAERVYSSDIKKVLLWFTQLKDADLLHCLMRMTMKFPQRILKGSSKEDKKPSKEKNKTSMIHAEEI